MQVKALYSEVCQWWIQGGPGGLGPLPDPQSWGPRLYSEAQITFWHIKNQKNLKFSLASLGILFQFIFFGPTTLKIFKPCSAQHNLRYTHHYKYALQICFNKYKSIKRFILLGFHRYGCDFHFSAYSMHTVYYSG